MHYQKTHLDLIKDLLSQMQECGADYTIVLRQLSEFTTEQPDNSLDTFIEQHKFNQQTFSQWEKDYTSALKKENIPKDERKKRMNSANPKFILRNHLAQIAIDKAEQGDYSEVKRLRKILSKPFDEQSEFEEYAAHPPQWAKEIEISCSS